MKLLDASWLFLLALELHLVNGAVIDNNPPKEKRTPIDYDLYLRDLDHDEVPPLDHLLAIRDQTSHVPISNTRITPGMLLDHILEINPTLKPAKVERMGQYQFNQYTFNESVWNGGVADMLSHAPVTSRIKLSDLKDATADREAHVGAVNPLPEEARTKRAVMSQFNDINDFFDTTNAALNPPPPKIASHILTPNLEKITFSRLYPTPTARCFEDKGKYVYGTLSDLREVSDYYCTIFDANMYKLVRGISLNDLGEFSLGTIYKAVKLDGGRTMRVNFQFIYQPKGYEAGQFWYPTSMFTGIQGVCHRMMRNFLSVSTAMPGCIGGSGTDTRGGWMGMDLGDRIDDRMVFRWAIDPYVRKSKEHDLPDPFPESERNNGLPRTDPKDVYQP